jgi:hypothetical protein
MEFMKGYEMNPFRKSAKEFEDPSLEETKKRTEKIGVLCEEHARCISYIEHVLKYVGKKHPGDYHCNELVALAAKTLADKITKL